MTPTQRSLKLLRASGYLAGIVESWVPYARKRRDLFGFADLLAVHPDRKETLLVQTTTGGHVAHRLAKIKAAQHLAAVLAAGCRVVVHGWRKSKRSRCWECRAIEVTAADLQETTVTVSEQGE